MRLFLTGSSGFLGRAFSHFFSSQGHQVIPFKRPYPVASLEGGDALLHLAGEPLNFGRWSRSKQERIRKSRVEGTLELTTSIARLKSPPPLFLSASAIGIYGDRGGECLTEKSSPGTGFLAEVCQGWERGAHPLQERGIRCASLRFGLVLGKEAPLWRLLKTVHQWGLGAQLGSGEQWISWIHLDDLLASASHVLHNSSLYGPLNFVSHEPLPQKEFSRRLAAALHRPAPWIVPAPLLRLLFGLMGEELLLSSHRVLPDPRLPCRYPTFELALQNLLSKI